MHRWPISCLVGPELCKPLCPVTVRKVSSGFAIATYHLPLFAKNHEEKLCNLIIWLTQPPADQSKLGRRTIACSMPDKSTCPRTYRFDGL